MNRAQKKNILEDLERKMVLLVGPRQVGKTWLAKEIATEFSKGLYLNYDNFKDQKIIHNQSWLMDTELLIFDGIHKMKDWKNYLKGIYDTKPDFQKILVTGSARLDVYETMGDSLAGRYFKHTLLPLSLSEIVKSEQTPDLERLIQRGGFPEPYLAEDEKESHRWRQQYVYGILSTDVFDVQSIENNKAFRLVFELIRSKVGSPLSYQSIAQDVGISPHTVKRYIQILEAVYLVFKITPYTTNIARSLLKEPKIYLFDSGLVEGDDGIKFENTVAVSLYKSTCFESEASGQTIGLSYLRTKDGREVDFAIIQKGQVREIYEVKNSDDQLSKSLKYFHQHYSYPACQIVRNLRTPYREGELSVKRGRDFLETLEI